MSMFDSEASFFYDDVDMDSIPDDPNELPANTYYVEVIDATVAATRNDENKQGLTLKFQILKGEYSSFFPFQTWLWKPKEEDVFSEDDEVRGNAKRALSRLKNYFMGLGFSKDELKGVTPGQLVGRKAYVTTGMKKQNGRKQVQVYGITSEEEYDAKNTGSDEGYDPFKSE